MDGQGKPTAIALVSGGIDSAVAAAKLKSKYHLMAMTIEYGQPVIEKVAAIHIKDWLGCEYRLCRIPSFGASREPSHYFPMRNLIFLAHAAQEAERIGAKAIIIGSNRDDFHDYPDCRDEFFSIMENTIRWGSFSDLTIERPLIDLTKEQVVRWAMRYGVPLEKTLSCYQPRRDTHCGECNACLLRKKAGAPMGSVERHFQHKGAAA